MSDAEDTPAPPHPKRRASDQLEYVTRGDLEVFMTYKGFIRYGAGFAFTFLAMFGILGGWVVAQAKEAPAPAIAEMKVEVAAATEAVAEVQERQTKLEKRLDEQVGDLKQTIQNEFKTTRDQNAKQVDAMLVEVGDLRRAVLTRR